MKIAQWFAGVVVCALVGAHAAAQPAAPVCPLPLPDTDFAPMEPEVSSAAVEVVADGVIVTTDIRLLSREDRLRFLSTTNSSTRMAKVDADGRVSYLTGNVTGERGKYFVLMDHASYFVEPVKSPDGTVIGKYRTGIGLRLVANIETRKRNIDLGGLLNIGLAASKQDISGSLQVVAFGVSGPNIAPHLPGIMSKIDESSIQSALESMAAIKSKFWESETFISPSRFSVRYFQPGQAEPVTPPRMMLDWPDPAIDQQCPCRASDVSRVRRAIDRIPTREPDHRSWP